MDGANNFNDEQPLKTKRNLENWVDFIPHREEVCLRIWMFNDYYVCPKRENGLNSVENCAMITEKRLLLPFDNETFIQPMWGHQSGF